MLSAVSFQIRNNITWSLSEKNKSQAVYKHKTNYLVFIWGQFFFIQTQPSTFFWIKEEAVQSLVALIPAGSECINEQTNKLSLYIRCVFFGLKSIFQSVEFD